MSTQMTTQEKALALHKEWNGKIETVSKPLSNRGKRSHLPTLLALQNPVKLSRKTRKLPTNTP